MTEAVAVAMGPSAKSALPLSVSTVITSAVTLTTSRFLARLSALNVPTLRRTTWPTLMPSVRYEPAARVTV